MKNILRFWPLYLFLVGLVFFVLFQAVHTYTP